MASPMVEPVPLINVEAPTDEGLGPRVLDDATSSVNSYFARCGDVNVRGLFSTLYPDAAQDHTLVPVGPITGFDVSFEYDKPMLYHSDIGLYRDVPLASALGGNFPYPFEYVSQGTHRSPPDVDGSPYSADGSFDAFEGLNSPGHQFSSPFLSSGDLSYANSSPSLSPLTRGMENVLLESEEAPLTKHSIFRTRSYSAAEATVAPSDTWHDPNGRPRSVSYSSPSSTINTDSQPSGYSSELDAIDLDDGFTSGSGSYYGERGLASFSNSGFLTSRSASPVPPIMPTGELNSSTLFAPADDHSTGIDIAHPVPRHPSPRQPVALSLNTDLSSQVHTGGRSHYRNRSDSSCLSADSPIDRRVNGLTHRSSLSSPESRRHSPYPSIHSSPVSAASESQLSPYLSSQDFANLGITDSSSAIGSGVHRRSTLSATRSPTLKVDNAFLHRAPSDPSSTRYGVQKRRNGRSRPSPGASTFIISSDPSFSVTSTEAGSRMVSPNGSVLSDTDLESIPSVDGYKPVVASQRIVQASNSRRIREARFKCEYEGCPSTFTAKHNLRNHMLSHNGVKPYECPNCGERFTTQGVRSRHEGKCTPEADLRRRKQVRR